MILDAQTLFPGDDDASCWCRHNVPLFECSDAEIERTYGFRWRMFHSHLKLTPEGYVVTEFHPDVPWAGIHNTISCSAGHHFYEGRWIRNDRYLDDYARFWFSPDAAPRSYSFWIADALYARYLVNGNAALLSECLDPLVANFEAWQRERSDDNGLYWQIDDRDGMEYQISGSGCRPTINSYLFADARAIAGIARIAGRSGLAARFEEEAERIRKLTRKLLWDDKARFFKTLPTRKSLEAHLSRYGEERMPPDQKPDELVAVRELQGYLPWTFGLMAESGFNDVWSHLDDEQGFAGKCGLSTAERRNPYWRAGPDAHTHDCLWRGSSWPFATSHTLMGLANAIDQGNAENRKALYFSLLGQYARAHRLETPDGVVPWIDESMHPDTGEWVTRSVLLAGGGDDAERGRNYNHSTFVDLVVTGLVGLRPSEDKTLVSVRPCIPETALDYYCLDGVLYHGKSLTIAYDRCGDRYGFGIGLHVFADGKRLLGSESGEFSLCG